MAARVVLSVPRSRISSIAASIIALSDSAVRSAWVSGWASEAGPEGDLDKGCARNLLADDKQVGDADCRRRQAGSPGTDRGKGLPGPSLIAAAIPACHLQP